MKTLLVAQEKQKVVKNRARSLRAVSRAQRAVEHYETEGFKLDAVRGQVVPFLDPHDSDYTERVAQVAQMDVMDDLEALARDLPLSFGSRTLRVTNARIGLVAGDTLTHVLRGTADFYVIDAETGEVPDVKLDLLLVGMPVVDLDLAWTVDILKRLSDHLIPAVKERGTPVAVLTTSDPMRTNATKMVASVSDVLFTTNPDGAQFYGDKLPASVTVEHIRAFFNPLDHSPAGRERHRVHATLVDGKLPTAAQRQRLEALRAILTGLRREKHPLIMPQGKVTEGYSEKTSGLFPSEFTNDLTRDADDFLRPRIRRLVDTHVMTHLYPGSAFSHPQETLEVLASGSAAMSTYSVGMNNDYPVVILPDGSDDAQLQIKLLNSDPVHLRNLQMEGIRRSFNSRTADQALRKILATLGMEQDMAPALTVAWRGLPDNTDVEAWEAQVLPPGVDAVRLDADSPVPENVQVLIDVPRGIDARHFLVQDVLNGFRMASVDRVQLGNDQPSMEFELVTRGFDNDRRVRGTWIGSGTAEHDGVFVMDDSSVIERNGKVSPAKVSAPELSVIVPVYNNGRFLLRKCLESLRRSSAFQAMEIILVDDGSTQDETRRIVEDTGRDWPNVRTYMFPPGGSGSASRPRNHGLMMVRTPWVTYLDPDNEAVGDGYAELLEICRRTHVNFAIGDMLRYAKTRTVTRNVGVLRSVIETNESGVGSVPEDALQRISFQPMSIQALVADTQWLKSLDLEQPLGALGQDSLFFQQMLHGARSIASLEKPIHTYYGEVAGSMVNTVSPSFFRKYVPLEESRSQWLRDENLFDDYVLNRMRRYVSVWFLPKFNRAVRVQDKDECFDLLKALCDMYYLPLIRSEDGKTASLG